MAVAGRVLMIPAGTWTSGTNYGMLDVVIYAGSSYVAKKQINNSTVAPPSAPSDWQLLAQGYDVTNVVTKSMIVNNFLATDPNTVLSGPMGKSLKDQLEQQNSNLTGIQNSFTEIKTVTIYQTRCDNLNGGYVKFGRLVIVSLQIRVLSPGTNFAMLTGFPVPLLGSGNVPVEMNGIKTLSNEATGVFINSVGSLCVRAAVANDYISVSGSYLST
ncbi:hypothetical protein [Lacrimispora indolis]|uniref:hypothetical protein n=1 Tax=Lacrimispora indolis TaxID=69825 RepID=UPI00040A910B|nr:hypothetical protein [[Clostridium] methoxybenzovorans]